MQIKYYQDHFAKYLEDARRHKKSLLNQKNSLYNLMDYGTESTLEHEGMPIISASSKLSSLFISYQEFYLETLDRIDLFQEYLKWQSMHSNTE
jgi:hypothetical protein